MCAGVLQLTLMVLTFFPLDMPKVTPTSAVLSHDEHLFRLSHVYTPTVWSCQMIHLLCRFHMFNTYLVELSMVTPTVLIHDMVNTYSYCVKSKMS